MILSGIWTNADPREATVEPVEDLIRDVLAEALRAHTGEPSKAVKRSHEVARHMEVENLIRDVLYSALKAYSQTVPCVRRWPGSSSIRSNSISMRCRWSVGN